MVTEAKSSPLTCCRLRSVFGTFIYPWSTLWPFSLPSATTSAHTPSVSCPARRTPNSRLVKISVRYLFSSVNLNWPILQMSTGPDVEETSPLLLTSHKDPDHRDTSNTSIQLELHFSFKWCVHKPKYLCSEKSKSARCKSRYREQKKIKCTMPRNTH